MRQRFTSLFNKPAFLVGLTALLTALVVAPGELGSIDTSRRLQTTRSFWTSAPPVTPGDIGLVGRNGQLHYWFGLGHSLLMLPADILARGTLSFISRFREPPSWLGEETIVNYLCSTLVCTLAVLVCFHFLRILKFSENESILGAFGLLFGTTFLHYTQNMQENNLLLLLSLTGFYFQYDWFRNGSTRSLFWGSLAFGANLLTRLTTGLDLVAGVVFISLCLWGERERRPAIWNRLIEYGRISIPCYLVCIAIDRLYQDYRFGSPFGTYLRIFGEQFRGKYPVTSPPGWPWSTPFWEGFLGPLITPEKSIFLFDPLVVLTLVLTFCLWKHFDSDIKAYVIALIWLLLSYIVFYARYYDWNGNSAWGDRFVTTPVQMLAIISIPVLLRYRASLKLWTSRLGKAIAAASVAIQIASVFFWHPLELRQMTTLGHPTFVIGLRFLNIIALATGMTDRWGLSNPSTLSDTSTPLNTPYFFPFLVMRRGNASGWKLAFLISGWICLFATLMGVVFLTRGRIRQSEESIKFRRSNHPL
jgi:hypothetical protein